MPESNRVWIFQGNPKIYDVKNALKELDVFHWTLRQHKSEVLPGDLVYIWASGESGGLLGKCLVDSEAFVGTDTEAESKFWLEKPEDTSETRVRLRKLEVFDYPVERGDLSAEPQLKELALLRMPQATNFAVTDSEASVLEYLTQPRPTFESIADRYERERITFQSTRLGALYSLERADDTGFWVNRLSANEPQRCSYSAYQRVLDDLAEAGGSKSYDDFVSNTVAQKIGVLQGPKVDLSADRKTVMLLEDEVQLLSHFCELLSELNVDRSGPTPKLYKPVFIAVIIEAIGSGELIENKFYFDDLLPRFQEKLVSLGESGGPQQAAYAFTKLRNDLFWLLAYKDFSDPIETNQASPSIVREKLAYASLKDEYWWVLRKASNRNVCLKALAAAWWPATDTALPNFWWVNQGKTFEEECQKELIRAPKANSDGDTKFHWTNVRDVEAGDIVFSYVSGFIRAVSIAVSDGDSEVQTEPSVDIDGAQDDAWVARLKYTELTSPVPLAPIANVLRKSTEKYSPIGKTGRVNQGYLYALNEQAVRVLGETIDLDALPDRVADPIKSLLGDQWGKFVYWGRRFFAVDSIRDGEREYKFSSEKRLVEVRKRIATGEGDWLAALKTAFTRNDSLTAWRSHGKFLEWCQANRDPAKQLLASFWDDSHELVGASKQFLEGLPLEALRGNGARVSILSFLALARDPLSCPMFRSTPFETGIRLTGYPLLPREEIEVYPHALDFLDRIIREAKARGFALQDRLDAQCFLWCVAEYDAPDEWTEEDKLALKNWRDGMSKAERNRSITGLSAIADELLLDAPYLQEIERLIESKGQVIFYGPPGTGKTFVAKAIAKHYAGEEGIEIVQFHPSYTYEDFVEGYRPCLHDGQPGFDLVKGPLRLLAQRAEENPDSKFVLLVDEINRGNVAKVFGELYFLLEYRDEGINLQYDRETKFKLPKNLWIIGTMNTADRSIALIDSALRRRFYFCPFFPDEQPVEPLLRRWLLQNKPHLEWIADVVQEANERLGDRHGAIGPSYFLRDDLTASWVETIWKHAILPYLAEQFFGEEERLKEFDLATLRKVIRQAPESTADEAN